MTEGERALKGNVREIIATTHKSGKDNPKTLVSKTLAQALKKIPKGQKFKIWAHVERVFDDDSFYHRNTKAYDSDNMAEFIDELDQAFDIQSAGWTLVQLLLIMYLSSRVVENIPRQDKEKILSLIHI